MRLSRRSAIAAGSVFAASAASPLPVLAGIAPKGRAAQVIQRTVIHDETTGGVQYTAPITVDASDTMWASFGRLDEAAYRKALETYRARGYGLRQVNVFETADGLRYSAAWQFGHATPAQVRDGMTVAEFQAMAAQAQRDGYALAHVDAATTRQGTRFAAIWEKSVAPQQVFAGLTADAYKQKVRAMAAQGFRPQRIAGYVEANRARFAVAFARDAVGHVAMHAIPADTFAAQVRDHRRAGYALRDASGYVVAGRPFYSAVWEQA
jgi:hypothetical protein